MNKGCIYKGTYSGWYSIRDECFYNESELVDGKAPTGAEVQWVAKEESYFFRLSDFEEPLLKIYQENPEMIAPKARMNEVVAFVKGGLKDLSVSRTSFKWGVPVPDDDHHVMYVWMDALANYVSALGYPNENFHGNFVKFWPASLHIVGKDILRFHAVYWPAILMAADLPLPKRLFAHGWWTKDGEKISKSLGNVIDPVELVEKVCFCTILPVVPVSVLHRFHNDVSWLSRFSHTILFAVGLVQYGVDQTRFFLMSEVNFGSDGDFSHEKMVRKVNTNLSNELGNLCQRTLTMVYKYCDMTIPMELQPLREEDETILSKAKSLRITCGESISTQAIHNYVAAMVSMIWDVNKYFDEMQPWALRKTDPKRMETVLYVLMEVLRCCAILYQPIIPTSANKILDLLGVPKEQRTFDHIDKGSIRKGATIVKPQAVFPRIATDS